MSEEQVKAAQADATEQEGTEEEISEDELEGVVGGANPNSFGGLASREQKDWRYCHDTIN
jgi:hypothetical protein